jgi:hypothetical protein
MRRRYRRLRRSRRAIGPENQRPAMTRFPNTTPGQSGGRELTLWQRDYPLGRLEYYKSAPWFRLYKKYVE